MGRNVSILSKYIKIFSYNNLWEKDTQIKNFNQEFKVCYELEHVSEFNIKNIKIGNSINKIMEKDYNSNIIISGAIVYIPKHLINVVDKYAGKRYERIIHKTMEGTDCQIYILR